MQAYVDRPYVGGDRGHDRSGATGACGILYAAYNMNSIGIRMEFWH